MLDDVAGGLHRPCGDGKAGEARGPEDELRGTKSLDWPDLPPVAPVARLEAEAAVGGCGEWGGISLQHSFPTERSLGR